MKVLHNVELRPEQFIALYEGRQIGCLRASIKARGTADFHLWVAYAVIDLLGRFFSYYRERQFEHVKRIFDHDVSTRKNIDNCVKSGFDVADGNVKHVDQAEVICLGETHISVIDRVRNGDFINELRLQPEDLILVEDGSNNPAPSRAQIKYVNSSVPVNGWDIEDIESHSAQICSYIYRALLLSPFISLISLPVAVYLRNWWGVLPVIGGCVGSVYYMKKMSNTVDDRMVERNQNLCKVIEQNKRPDRRIVVIGGRLHFSLQNRRSSVSPQDKEAVKELTDYLKKSTRFVVLNPKETNRSSLSLLKEYAVSL